MTPRAVAIIRNTMTTLEYKGFRIEVTSVGKGWRGAIFEPGSTRAFSIFAMFKSNKDDRELEAWFDCNGHKWTEGPCHSDPDACHYSSEELCESIALSRGPHFDGLVKKQ